MTKTLRVLLICLAIASPAAAQQLDPIQSFRQNYEIAMANFQRVAVASGDTAAAQHAADGRRAMRAVTDDQLRKLFSKSRVPDFSVVSMATQYLASKSETRNSSALLGPMTNSAGFPGAHRLGLRWRRYHARDALHTTDRERDHQLDSGGGRLGVQRGHSWRKWLGGVRPAGDCR
jgi:hypothetical protein